MLQKIRNFGKKQEGATAIEYALMVVVIALVMVIGAKTLGTALSTSFTTTGTAVTGG